MRISWDTIVVGYDGDTAGYHGIYKQQSDLNLSKNEDTPKIEIPQKRQFEGVTVVINHGGCWYCFGTNPSRHGKANERHMLIILKA